jgi:hypothetical protein
MAIEAPPFDTQYSIVCANLSDGTHVVLQSDSSGRLLVNAAGVTLTCDDIDLDVFGITGGTGGDPGTGGKTLADLAAILGATTAPASGTVNKQLADIEANTDRMNLLAMNRISVSTDAALSGSVTINANVKRIILVPASVGVHQNLSAAATEATPSVLASHPHDVTAATAALIHLYAASAIDVDVYQYG